MLTIPAVTVYVTSLLVVEPNALASPIHTTIHNGPVDAAPHGTQSVHGLKNTLTQPKRKETPTQTNTHSQNTVSGSLADSRHWKRLSEWKLSRVCHEEHRSQRGRVSQPCQYTHNRMYLQWTQSLLYSAEVTMQSKTLGWNCLFCPSESSIWGVDPTGYVLASVIWETKVHLSVKRTMCVGCARQAGETTFQNAH